MMSQPDREWSLYNHKTGKVFKNFTSQEIVALAFLLKNYEQQNWMVWKNGWSQWRFLGQVEALNEFEAFPFEHLDAESQIDIIRDSEKNQDGEGSKQSFGVTRAYQRFSRRMKIVVELDGQSFTTYSVNISVGGMLIQDPVPDWVVGYCNIQIIKKEVGEEVDLTCSVVDDQKPGQRYRLELAPFATEKEAAQFQKWISG